jgi:hypothetical protein
MNTRVRATAGIRANLAALGVALALSLATFVSFAEANKRAVPIMIGGSEEMDACGSWAAASGLNPKGDGFLAVRSGPGTEYSVRDKLREGAGFYVCGSSQDGKWLQIVYPRKGQDSDDCGVSSPIAHALEYRGPCDYGWVNARWVKVIAG